MYGYIYETTNLINGKKYIGKHKSNSFDNKYYGSGRLFKEDLAKYGKENFSIRVLEEIDNENDLHERETYYIKLFDAVRSPKYYNNSYGGEQEGWQGVNRMFKYNKEKWIESRKKSANSLSGRTHSKEWRNNISKGLKGKPKSEEHRLHLRNVKKAFSAEQRYKIGLNFGTLGKTSSLKGLTKENSETLRKISESQRKTKSSKEWKETIGLEARKKISETRCKNGSAKGKKNPMYNVHTIYVSNINLDIAKRIKPEELDKYLLEGWIKGNIHKMKIVDTRRG